MQQLFLLFGALFDDCEVSVADLLANLVFDTQLRRFSNWLVVRRICTECAEYLGLCELTIIINRAIIRQKLQQ